MSTVVTLDGENEAIKTIPNAPVAGVLHTCALVAILLGGSGLMYLTSGQLRMVDHPNRIALYLTTIVWEWILTAYVLVGVRRYGTSLEEVTGAKWKNVLEFVRDVGIAVAFWFAALLVLGATAIALHFKGSRRRAQEQGRNSYRHASSPLLFVFKARGRPVSLFSVSPR